MPALPPRLPIRLSALAAGLGGMLVGPDADVAALASLGDARPGDLSFFADKRYARLLGGCGASGVLVAEARAEVACGQVVVADPESAFLALAREVARRPPPAPGVHPTAVVHPGADVSPEAHVGPLGVIEAGARVGAGAVLHAQVFVGEGAIIHEGAVLHPGVKILGGCEIGPHTTVHAGSVIGADGFGYRWDGQRHAKVPQLGRVVVEGDVEIGALTAIDRAALGETRIRRGARIDNLVQVGHGAQVGEHAVLCGQVGLAGSSLVGRGAVLGGQVGLADHAEVGDGARVAAQSGVAGHVPPGETVAGTPAIPLRAWRRAVAAFPRLPELLRRLKPE